MKASEMNQILDHLIANPRDDQAGRYALVTAFLGAMLILPSGGDMVTGDGSFQPVLSEENGERLIVAYGSKEAAMQTQDIAPYGVTATGADLVRRIGPEFGLMVITDSGKLALDSQFMGRIRADIDAGRA
ncbi:hypothetical protein [Demequina aurantiaca]|uniref:hypothetical protein n=1 Tax=Demequina aurantiaca TaxID=676200 RepID=UPI003D359943